MRGSACAGRGAAMTIDKAELQKVKKVFWGAKNRILNPKNKDYPKYGGRGLTWESDWDDFDTFISEVGMRPTPKHTLERIDNDKGYIRGNVRWATKREQDRNKRTNNIVEFRGERMILTDAASAAGLNRNTVWNRLYRDGWSMEDALNTPAGGGVHL